MLKYEMTDEGLAQPARTLPVSDEYDVIVTGGGVAGCGAALAAAQMGCSVLLIERESALGGLATVGLVNIPLDFAGGLSQTMLDRLTEMNAHWHRHSDPEKHKLLLDRWMAEAGVKVLLVSQVVDAVVKNGAVCGVVTENKSGRQAWMARRVIDASGDADTSCFAGCEYMVGRAEDGISQGCSLEFRLGGVDYDKFHESDIHQEDPKWIEVINKALETGELPYPIDNHLNWMTHLPGRPEHVGKDEVSICFAHSRNCRPLDAQDLTRMYIEGREQCDILWKFIKNNIPGFENCWLIDTAPLLGVREGRRVLGEYVLTGYDLASRARFDDVISISSHGYDVHGPEAPGNIKWAPMEIDGEVRPVVCNRYHVRSTTLQPPEEMGPLCDYKGRTGEDMEFPQPNYYDIPYRSLVPVDVENLLVAGRCLSSDFYAQSGSRLILCCMNMGEAAGVATALSLKHDVAPRQVDRVELQGTLIDRGMNLGQSTRAIPGVTES